MYAESGWHTLIDSEVADNAFAGPQEVAAIPGDNSPADVLRFVLLRPGRSAVADSVQVMSTPLAVELGSASSVRERARIANRALADKAVTVRDIDDLRLGRKIMAAFDAARTLKKPTTASVLSRLKNLTTAALAPEVEEDRTRLSDTLMAALLGTRSTPIGFPRLQVAFRIYALVAQGGVGRGIPLDAYLRRPIEVQFGAGDAPFGAIAPGAASHASGTVGLFGPRRPSIVRGPTESPELLAAREIFAMDFGPNIRSPESDGQLLFDRTAFTLNTNSQGRLRQPTIAVLRKHRIDLDLTPAHAVVTLLTELAESVRQPTAAPRPQLANAIVGVKAAVAADGPIPQIRPAGVAQLLVVKQQIKRYEAGEIAHVENVLSGEKRVRTHRQLERTEDTFTRETETTRINETELETAERFEMQQETARTVREESNLGFNLSLSGRYGPTVEFGSALDVNSAESVEESARNATTYSQDIMQRSLERLTERIREQRVRRVIYETEETNLHELSNPRETHSAGVYQFLDKIYEAQIFDYGIREMFDFLVPEPASYLWYVDRTPQAAPNLPDPPPPLEDLALDASHISESNYKALAAMYGAADVEQPPPPYVKVTGLIEHGDVNAGEEGRPRSHQKLELAIPENYLPWHASIIGLALSDDQPIVGISVGDRNLLWAPSGPNQYPQGDGDLIASGPSLHTDFSTQIYLPAKDSKLPVQVVAWETATYTVNVQVLCRRSERAYDEWAMDTYNRIRAAYESALQQHTQVVSEIRARAEAREAESKSAARFGQPPSQNRLTIREELKKHCLTMLSGEQVAGSTATNNEEPPKFDPDVAELEGSLVRFLEQAFEWDQLQYVFYPYFWARQETWLERFCREDTDPEFRDFWRAGYARVVVPARPGFEEMLTHYIVTGKPWGSLTAPPDVTSEAFVSIVEEIKERTGGGQGEVPVGDAWEVRVPTAMVFVRPAASELPAWTRVDQQSWVWNPV